MKKGINLVVLCVNLELNNVGQDVRCAILRPKWLIWLEFALISRKDQVCLKTSIKGPMIGLPNIESPLTAKSRDIIWLIYSACANQLVSILTDILDTCSESKWLVTNELLQKYLEFALWDSYRFGVSMHCSGASPCLWTDTDKILTLVRKSIGESSYD